VATPPARDTIVTAVKPTVGPVVTAPARVTTIATTKEEKIRIAKQKGYEGDPCSNCQQLTMVRSGACMKCDTCGETSGCS
jgi:ribonucleoside-diphosphate reductase alpha chain